MSMTIEDIKRVTADTLGVLVSDIDGRGRSQKISLARQIAIYFSRKQLGVEAVGRHFNRIHSNISYTCKRVDDFLECDPEFTKIIKKVEAKLG